MLPPIWAYTHEPVLILSNDRAWDTTRIKAEEALILAHAARADGLDESTSPLASCKWATVEEHPISLYHSGKSRFDLDTVAEYLLPDVEPTRFFLVRMGWEEFKAVKSRRLARDFVGANELALKYGLRRVSGLDGLGEWQDRDAATPEPLTRAQVIRLRRLVGDLALDAISAAAWVVAQEVTEIEGKL